MTVEHSPEDGTFRIPGASGGHDTAVLEYEVAPGVWIMHHTWTDPAQRGRGLAARVVGAETTEVKSAHHQGVEELGEGVAVSGNADDGVVEAIELPDRSFAVGVLWHPEEDERSRVIGSLVEEARSRHASPAARLREATPPREAHG